MDGARGACVRGCATQPWVQRAQWSGVRFTVGLLVDAAASALGRMGGRGKGAPLRWCTCPRSMMPMLAGAVVTLACVATLPTLMSMRRTILPELADVSGGWLRHRGDGTGRSLSAEAGFAGTHERPAELASEERAPPALIPTPVILRAALYADPASPITADDLTITDTFIRGRCLYAVIAQARNVTWYKDLSKLTATVLRPLHSDADPAQAALSVVRRAAAGSSRVDTYTHIALTQRRVWTTSVWHTQSSACMMACGAEELSHVDSTEVEFRYADYAPARVVVSRVFLSGVQPGTVHSAVCTMMKGTSSAHLATWIQYHNSIGFDHVFVYVNEAWEDFSNRPGVTALADLAAAGKATFVAWFYPRWYPQEGFKGHFAQTNAANDCHRRFREHVEHFAFVDVDEFIYVTQPLRTLLGSDTPCVLLGCTWGIADAIPNLSLKSLLDAPITAVGPLVKLHGDVHALYRHKLYAHANSLGIVGIHGAVAAVDMHGRMLAPPACPFVWNFDGTDTAVDPRRAGFLHVLSPSLKSARPRPDHVNESRVSSLLEQEILGSAQAYHTKVLSESVAVAARDAAAVPPALADPTMHFPAALLRRGIADGLLTFGLDDFAAQDMLVVDAILLGSCVTVVVAQPRNPATMHDFSRLQLKFMGGSGGASPSSLGADGMTLPITKSVSVTAWQDQGCAYAQACSADLRDIQLARIQVSYAFPELAGAPLAAGTSSVVLSVPRQHVPSRIGSVAICAVARGSFPPHFSAWIDYHIRIGAAFVFVYTNVEHPAALEMLRYPAVAQALSRGQLRLVNWPFPRMYPGDARSHVWLSTAQNDCVQRFGGFAESLVFLDAEDYLYLHPHYSLLDALVTVANASHPCALLSSTTGVLRRMGDQAASLDSLDLPLAEPDIVQSPIATIIQSELLTVAPLHPFVNEPGAAARRKVFVRAAYPALLGINGLYQPADSPCRIATGLVGNFANPAVMGVVRVLWDASLHTHSNAPAVAALIHEIMQHPDARPSNVLRDTLQHVRGYCRRCVDEAPLTEAQLQETAIHQRVADAEQDAQFGPYFAWQRAAFLRCERAPACSVPRPHLALVGDAWQLQNKEVALERLDLLNPASLLHAPQEVPVPLATRLLVQGENSRGRYSNMRHAILDFVQLGLLLNRTVVLAPMAHSVTQCKESMEELFDWPHLNKLLRVLAPPPGDLQAPRYRLHRHCLGTRGKPAPTMLQNMERHQRYTPRSTTILPTWGQWKVAGGIAWDVLPYTKRRQMLQLFDELRSETCVGLSSGFWAFPYAFPDHARLHNALRPSASVTSVISDFLMNTLRGASFVGVHMRLTDLGFANSSFCARNMTQVVGLLTQLMDAHDAHLVALATDDPSSACAQDLVQAFPGTVSVASGVYHPDSCSEAQFVQEVLARSSCFVGTLNSTMSRAVQDIRDTDRARLHRGTPLGGKPGADCVVNLPAGQVRFEW